MQKSKVTIEQGECNICLLIDTDSEKKQNTLKNVLKYSYMFILVGF